MAEQVYLNQLCCKLDTLFTLFDFIQCGFWSIFECTVYITMWTIHMFLIPVQYEVKKTSKQYIDRMLWWNIRSNIYQKIQNNIQIWYCTRKNILSSILVYHTTQISSAHRLYVNSTGFLACQYNCYQILCISLSYWNFM